MNQQQHSKQDPPSLKQRIETHLSDKIDFRLTAKTKDRLSNIMQARFTNKSQPGDNIAGNNIAGNNNGGPINPTAHQAFMPRINSWSDSRPQANAGF
jgi:hypothetical protein